MMKNLRAPLRVVLDGPSVKAGRIGLRDLAFLCPCNR
jgi:hypothetical protein